MRTEKKRREKKGKEKKNDVNTDEKYLAFKKCCATFPGFYTDIFPNHVPNCI